MEWNEESIARLRALWAEGLSTAAIGRRMGVSKNAVVGKAHRLNLPSRPSPIHGDGNDAGPRRQRSTRVKGATLARLESLAEREGLVAKEPYEYFTERDDTGQLTNSPPHLAALPVCDSPVEREPAASLPVTGTCLWPMCGHYVAPTQVFCGADTRGGKSYCAEHCELAYTKAKPASEQDYNAPGANAASRRITFGRQKRHRAAAYA
jgi:GcrA cell cycle regulator